MTEVFVDSFFWMATLNPRDTHHQWALRTPKPPRSVTTTAVLLEVMNSLHATRWRSIIMDFWRQVHADPDIVVIPLGEDLLQRAAALLENRPDKDWSLTDCVSFIVMNDRQITEALTGDHHFVQAGFQIRFP